MIRVGIVDDQPLVRAGFAMLIGSQDDMEVVWQAGDGDEIPEGESGADIILMDVQMARTGGIPATRRVLSSDRHVRVIMLTTFDDERFVSGAIAAGASGFLLKDAQPEELLDAVRTVHSGAAVLAPSVTAELLERLRTPGQTGVDAAEEQIPAPVPLIDPLTPRETEILRLVALGYNNDEIAAREFVSMATVKTHIRHILAKTGSRDRVHAVLYAYRTGLVGRAELLAHPGG